MPAPNAAAGALTEIEAEILGEQANALGRAGDRLHRALAELDAAEEKDREIRLAAARQALWFLIVQREACGMRNTEALLQAYAVPPEVGRGVLLPPLFRRRQRR